MKFYGVNDYAGVETEWFGGDDLELYNYNLEKHGSDWEYKDKKITYRFNKNGFRCDKEFKDIDWENSTALFGCSFAFGLANSSDETISYYLEELLDRPVINFGISAGSNDLIINNMLALKELGEPKEVIHMWTFNERWAVYNNDYCLNIGPWTDGQYANDPLKSDYYRSTINFVPSSHYDVIVEQQNKITSLIWSNTKLYNFAFPTVCEPIKHLVTDITPLIDLGDRARDDGHYGAKTNKACAEIIYNKIKEN